MVHGRATFDERYERIKLLGEGAYGAAYLVRPKDKRHELEVAKEIRTAHLTDKQREGVLAESKVLRMMKHPNVVGYKDSFSEPPKMYIIMEYADGGDLAAKIKERKTGNRRFEEKDIMFIFVQVALALQHIHSRKVLHRDLKPLNIFLTKQGLVKLGDFGIARLMDSSMAEAKTTIGTPFYLSPEMCNSEGYNLKSDLWSLGVVTYELTVLRVPFGGVSLPAVALQIMGAEPDPLPKEYSADLNWIVFRFLEKEPSKRPNLDQVLRMPFVQSYIQVLLSHSKHSGAGGCETLGAPGSGGGGGGSTTHGRQSPAGGPAPARRLPEVREDRESKRGHSRHSSAEPDGYGEPRGAAEASRAAERRPADGSRQSQKRAAEEDRESKRSHTRHSSAEPHGHADLQGPLDAAERRAADVARQVQRRANEEARRRAVEAQRRADAAEEEFRQREEASRAGAALANEFMRNREAAAETRRRNMGFDIQVVVEEGSERRGSFWSSNDGERFRSSSDGEQRKAEVRRRAQEERNGKDAAQWRELERARLEYVEDMRRMRNRMLEQQSGDAAEEATGACDDWAGYDDELQEQEMQTLVPGERRGLEDCPSGPEVRPARRGSDAEAEHLMALERARREAEEDRRRLEEKYKSVRFCDEAVEAGSGDEVATDDDDGAGSGPCLVPPRRNVQRVVLPDMLAAVPEEANQDNVDAECAEISELIIPFTDKIRPKPKLSSDSRPSRRARSQSSADPGGSSGAATASSCSMPGATGRGRRGGRGRGNCRGGPPQRASVGPSDADVGSDGITEPGTLPAVTTPSGARPAPGGRRLQRASGSPAQWMRGPPSAAADAGRSVSGLGGPSSPPRSPAFANAGGGAAAFSSAAAALGAAISAAATATLDSRTLSQGLPSPKSDGDVTQLQDVLAGALCSVEGQAVPGGVSHGRASTTLDWNDTLGWGDTLQLADTLSYTADSGLGLDLGQ